MSLEHTHAILDAFAGVLDDDTAREVIDYRKRMGKRYALTERSARMLAKNLASCPDPIAAAEEMIVRGWQSIKPEWMARINQQAQRPGIAGAAQRIIDGQADNRGDYGLFQRLPAIARH